MTKKEKELLLNAVNRYIKKNHCLQRDSCYGCDFEETVVPCGAESDTLDDIDTEEVLQIIENIEPDQEQPSNCPCCGAESCAVETERGDYVVCSNTHCDFTGPLKQTEADAIDEWDKIVEAMKRGGYHAT